MDSWKEISDKVMACPVCGHEEIMMSVADGPKNCECLRCGESSAVMNVSLEDSVKIWNNHVKYTKKMLQEINTRRVLGMVDGKLTLDIDELKKALSLIARINMLDIADITFVEGEEELDIPKKVVEEFKFTGLNNIDFIKTEYYKEKE